VIFNDMEQEVSQVQTSAGFRVESPRLVYFAFVAVV
jgi:hypothetical protein